MQKPRANVSFLPTHHALAQLRVTVVGPWAQPRPPASDAGTRSPAPIGGPIDVAVFDRTGNFIRSLPGPTDAALGPVVPVGGGKVVYGVTTFFDPFRYMLFNEAAGSAVEADLSQTSGFDFSDCLVTRDFATASDGTRIPVTIISRKATLAAVTL